MHPEHQPGCFPWGSPNPGHFPASAPLPCSSPAWVPFPWFTCPSLPGELLLILQNPFPRYLLWTSVAWGRPATSLRLSRVPWHPRWRAPSWILGSPTSWRDLDGKCRGSVHSESLMPRRVPGTSHNVGKQLVNGWGSGQSRSGVVRASGHLLACCPSLPVAGGVPAPGKAEGLLARLSSPAGWLFDVPSPQYHPSQSRRQTLHTP